MIFNQNFDIDIEEDILLEELTDIDQPAHLVIYNDDHNTFEWVIQCLEEICSCDSVQAEQLSMMIHFKGKAIVKTDAFNVLKPKKDALIERGLSAVIEQK
jgi:ATP-dependent Clp protease adaptor protein ClpS